MMKGIIDEKKVMRKAYALYVADWCKERGCRPKDVDPETGFGGECYVCFEEFLDYEWLDEAYMKALLPPALFSKWEDVVDWDEVVCAEEEEDCDD